MIFRLGAALRMLSHELQLFINVISIEVEQHCVSIILLRSASLTVFDTAVHALELHLVDVFHDLLQLELLEALLLLLRAIKFFLGIYVVDDSVKKLLFIAKSSAVLLDARLFFTALRLSLTSSFTISHAHLILGVMNPAGPTRRDLEVFSLDARKVAKTFHSVLILRYNQRCGRRCP